MFMLSILFSNISSYRHLSPSCHCPHRSKKGCPHLSTTVAAIRLQDDAAPWFQLDISYVYIHTQFYRIFVPYLPRDFGETGPKFDARFALSFLAREVRTTRRYSQDPTHGSRWYAIGIMLANIGMWLSCRLVSQTPSLTPFGLRPQLSRQPSRNS